MKKKFSLTILLLVIITPCFSQNHYKINVNIKNLAGKVSLYKLGSDEKVDSLSTMNGIFELKGIVPEEGIYALIANGFISSFVINGGDIRISGDINDIKNLRVEDNGENFIHKIWSQRKDKLDLLLDSIDKRLKKSKKQLNITEYNNLNNEKIAYQLKENKFIEDSIIYINPSKYWALYILDENFENFEINAIKKLYERLSPELKRNSLGRSLYAKIINGRKQLHIGQKAPIFSLRTKEATVKKLSDYKGKYVVLNFWASWCIPCRQEIQELKHLYRSTEKYKTFQFISISLDENKSSWIKALNDEKMPWINLTDLRGFDSKLSISYNVKEIPYNLIIDKDGKIMYIGDSISGTQKKIKDIFHSN